ncbi:MAG: LAGLIDADG family homing endonuclease [Parcubacteria group bacterium]|nr:LAGLIDADG family homing endonuclease [Parcubacteria group bacterium]
MGSHSKNDLAYISGFLDGDGSLMLQIKKYKYNKSGKRFMVTICFYQDSRHDKPLYWIRKIFGIGYISKRNDGITELRINGYSRVRIILEKLLPFIKFKKKQARILYKASKLLEKEKKLKKTSMIRLVDYIVRIQEENYVTRKKRSKDDLLKFLGLTP